MRSLNTAGTASFVRDGKNALPPFPPPPQHAEEAAHEPLSKPGLHMNKTKKKKKAGIHALRVVSTAAAETYIMYVVSGKRSLGWARGAGGKQLNRCCWIRGKPLPYVTPWVLMHGACWRGGWGAEAAAAATTACFDN